MTRTAGRLTSEMAFKYAHRVIPVLMSRCGMTGMGRKLAAQIGISKIGDCQGRHHLLFTGRECLVDAPSGP